MRQEIQSRTSFLLKLKQRWVCWLVEILHCHLWVLNSLARSPLRVSVTYLICITLASFPRPLPRGMDAIERRFGFCILSPGDKNTAHMEEGSKTLRNGPAGSGNIAETDVSSDNHLGVKYNSLIWIITSEVSHRVCCKEKKGLENKGLNAMKGYRGWCRRK